MTEESVRLEPVSFQALPGWGKDSGLDQAYEAYIRTAQSPQDVSSGDYQSFFETNFQPMKVLWSGPNGQVTGYYEPLLKGSLKKSSDYQVAVYRRPADLVCLIDDKQRAKFNDELTYVQATPNGQQPYPTRKEIESGALADKELELLYLKDHVDAYFLHVQGSGCIELKDGTCTRVTYAAKNGHPYASIGRILIDRGYISQEDMSLQAVQTWLRTHPQEAREIMWQNKSFIFFSVLTEEDAQLGPHGAAGVPLTPERSLAVDASIHALGTPIWVSAPTLTLKHEEGYHKLMIAQDVGSAIKGPERGDIFWGSGDEAGNLAGRTNHPANFFILLPK